MLLDKIKLALRLNHDLLDTEILALISACKQDLSLAGIKNLSEEESMIEQAIKMYVKYIFEQDVKRAELYEKAYSSIKLSMSVCEDFKQEPIIDDEIPGTDVENPNIEVEGGDDDEE